MGFDQPGRQAGGDGEHQAGKAGAAADIGDRGRIGGQMADKLDRIEHVAVPHMGQGIARHQVQGLLPFCQLVGIKPQPVHCFT